MKKWFNKGVKQYLAHRYRQIVTVQNNPIWTQEEVLRSLLERAKDTRYGKSFRFSSINNIKDFSNHLPITDYDDLKPSIYEMMDGASDILWKGKINWYAKSSGTTSDRSKYIPVSNDSLYRNNVASSWDTMSIIYHNDPQSQIFWKKSLIMGGSLSTWEHNSEVNVGDISAILLHRMPAIGRPFYSPDFKTALIDDWEEKIRRMTSICIKEDIVMFGGVPTWTIVLFKRILEQTGASNIQEVWPNVKYYLHGGVGFDPYVDQFNEFLPNPEFSYFEVYNASEGYFAVQDRRNENGMLLLLDNDIYYEFVTMDELTKDNPITINLGEIELHVNYAIIISSSSGLWRYMPGDTICFTSKNPYRIKVSGRTKHFINAFGEEVMVGNTDKALAETINALPAIVSEYTVAPIFMNQNSRGGHLWLIEFEKTPDNLAAFEILLDDNLRKINSDYSAKRYKNIALQCLQIKVIPSGTFHKWLASKGKIGGQNKVPRLYNSRKYVDELLAFVSIE